MTQPTTEPPTEPKTYTITKLQTANVLNLTVVEIDPVGHIVTIGGRNDAGKSNVLHSIQYAVDGTRSIPPKPLREGARRGKTIVTLSDGTRIVRTYTPHKSAMATTSSLEVIDPEGNKVPSPQTWLRGIVGELSFDPMGFARKKPDEQAEILRKLVGADTSTIDAERKGLYEERTAAGREVNRLATRVEGIAHDPGVPAELVSVQDIAAELEGAMKISAANAEARREANEMRTAAARERDKQTAIAEAYDRQRQEIADLEDRLRGLKEDCEATRDRRDEEDKRVLAQEHAAVARAEEVKALNDPDMSVFRNQMSEAEAINQRVRRNKERADVVADLRAAEDRKDALGDSIEDCDERKAKLLADASFPIEGLGFGDRWVTLGGLPLEQANKATLLRVSVAIGIALNPSFRIMFVEDGSLLDGESLATMARMAEEAGMQIWMEIVTDNPDECQVFIEDGHVAELPAAEGSVE